MTHRPRTSRQGCRVCRGQHLSTVSCVPLSLLQSLLFVTDLHEHVSCGLEELWFRGSYGNFIGLKTAVCGGLSGVLGSGEKDELFSGIYGELDDGGGGGGGGVKIEV